jgi:fructose-1,6-bisphosphatase/sedoheptulose 1,7-bisphosphatase-like protein
VHRQLVLKRVRSIEIVRATERAAVSAAWRGAEKAADQAAIDAMRHPEQVRENGKLLTCGGAGKSKWRVAILQ